MFTLFRCFTDGCESYDGKPLMERMRPKYGVLLVATWRQRANNYMQIPMGESSSEKQDAHFGN